MGKNVDAEVPVHSCRIRVGRSIQGFGLSPGITKQQRVDVEALMINAFKTLEGDLAGNYYALTGMDEAIRQQLVDDHFLFVSGDPNLKVAGMERDWPAGRGIFHNAAKTFLVWQGLPNLPQIRLYPLLPNQLGNWYACFCPR